MVSICVVTYERYWLTEECVAATLHRADEEYELLSVDNGSQDRRVVSFIEALNPRWHWKADKNYGYAAAVNQMLLRARGDYIMVLDPDIVLPPNWLSPLIEAYRMIPYSGITGIHCTQELPQLEQHCGIWIHPTRWKHLAPKFYSRETLKKFGSYDERFGLYGQEDVLANYAVTKMGLLNYYVEGCYGKHSTCTDWDPPGYAKFKADCAKRTDPLLQQIVQEMDRKGIYYTQPPKMIKTPADA